MARFNLRIGSKLGLTAAIGVLLVGGMLTNRVGPGAETGRDRLACITIGIVDEIPIRSRHGGIAGESAISLKTEVDNFLRAVRAT